MKVLEAAISILRRWPPAGEDEVASAEGKLGKRLPDDLKSILRQSNGAEGFIRPDAYLFLWSAADIASLNVAYSTDEFVPGLVLIGTNGSDVGYGFKWEGGNARYYSLPLIGMSTDALELLGSSASEMFDRLCARPDGGT